MTPPDLVEPRQASEAKAKRMEMEMAMNGYNKGIWHAVHKFGQPTLCKRSNAVMACEVVTFRDGREQCKRCAAKLAEMDARSERKKVGTIDITPTWSALVPLYLAAVCDGSLSASSAAREEIARMAALADAYVAGLRYSWQKELDELLGGNG